MISERLKINRRVCFSVVILVVVCILYYPLYIISKYNVSQHQWFFSHHILDLPTRNAEYFNTRRLDYDGWTPGFPKWLVDLTELQSKLPKNVTSIGHHEILYYNERPADRIRQENVLIKQCPYQNCNITDKWKRYDESSAVIFEISHHYMGLPNRTKPNGQVWIFLDFEPPRINNRWEHRQRSWNGKMNWSMSYRYDSDIIRNFGFLKERRPEAIPKKDYHEVFTRKKKFAAWIVSNCGHSDRDEYVAELRKYIPIDVYGACGTLMANRTREAEGIIVSEYRFYLGFENSFCTDYITEKFTSYFKISDAILVVRGGADYDKLLPEYTHINAQHYKNAKDLATYMLSLNRSEDAYTRYLKTRDKYYVAQLNWACNLCIKLNNKKQYQRQYNNIVEWWHTDKCWAATDVIVTWTAKRKWMTLFLVLSCSITVAFIYIRKLCIRKPSLK